MKRKCISVFVCAILILMQISAAAAGFSDVDSKKYSWAYNQIEEMTGLKIINGYPDGTFKPDASVSRIDSLLLISRILGAEEEAEKQYADAALEKYFGEVNVIGYSNYEKNLAYLLYRGLYTPTELRSFLSSRQGDKPLLRHEAAVLVTKTMGAEEEVKKNPMTVLDYKDADSIPAASKAYVDYCAQKGLMKGVEDNQFMPLGNVTRAQMAVMLYNCMKKLDLTTTSGTVFEVNDFSSTIKFNDTSGNEQSLTITEEFPLKLNGENLGINEIGQIGKGDKINVIRSNTDIIFAELVTVVKDEVMDGVFSGKTTTSTYQKITVKPVDGTTTKEYTLADDCQILLNKEIVTLDKLTNGDHVKVTVQNGKAILIDAEKKDKTVNGYISDFVYETPAKMKIKLSDNSIVTYEMNASVKVTRNGKESDVKSLLVGDRVTLGLVYDKISTVTATSVSKTATGTISEIVISQNPSIKVKTDDETIECALSTSLDITINDEPATVYDLKLGYEAKVTMESATVTKVEITSTPPVETYNIVGTAEYVDTNYMFISIKTADGETKQVFVKKNTTIIDGSTQKSRTLASIKQGSTITVVISSDGFVPEAISIVVLAEPKQ